jgi:VCBS repeat-containing protein
MSATTIRNAAHSAPRHRKTERTSKAHELCLDEQDAAVTAASPRYARYVGRVGALAMALGVGAAMATGQGLGVPMVWAEETGTSDGGPADPGPAAGEEPAGPGPAEQALADPPAPIDGVEKDDPGAAVSDNPYVPDMNFEGGVDTEEEEVEKEDPDAAVYDNPYVPDMNFEGGVDTEEEEVEEEEQASPNSEVISPPPPPPPADPPAASGNNGSSTGTVPQGNPTLPAPPDPNTDGLENENPNTTPDADPPRQNRMAMVVDDGFDAAGGASLMVAAAAVGTPAPHPVQEQPDNLIDGVLGAPVALANIAVTAVNAFLTSIFAPGPTTPPPPVMLFVVLGWVQRELQRTFNNQSPTAVADTTTTSEDADIDIDVLANDVDPDVNTGPNIFPGDALTVTDYTQPANGTVVLNADGTFTYTPDAALQGLDAGEISTGTFTYTVSDEASPWHIHGLGGLFFGGAHDSTTTVTVTVTGVNDAPVAVNDAYSTDEDIALTVPSPGGVMQNDTDVDGETLTSTVLDGPDNGSLTLSTDGSFVYTPNANFNGTDTFTYTLSDGDLTDAGSVTITVNPINDAPVAAADSYSTAEDIALTVPLSGGVIDNDTDIDNATLTSTVLDGPDNGTLTLSSDGSFVYTPNADFNGTDSFTYTLSDGTLTDTATVTITVIPIDEQVGVGVDAVAIGYNVAGQTNIPALPPGVFYTHVDGGTLHTVLVRSDGTAVAVGANSYGQTDIPALPPGVFYTQASAGDEHTVLLRSDGTAVAVGNNSYGQTDIPALPPGVFYTQVSAGIGQASAGIGHTVLLRSDGTAVAVGNNGFGQTDIPALPPGVFYTQVSAGHGHTVLLRSDGTAVAVGANLSGETNIPALPPGLFYTQASAGSAHTVLLRSDGTAVAVGFNGSGETDIPALPPGVFYTQVSAGLQFTVLLRSDGTAVAFGLNGEGQSDIPALPPGAKYTQVTAGGAHTVLLTDTVV